MLPRLQVTANLLVCHRRCQSPPSSRNGSRRVLRASVIYLQIPERHVSLGLLSNPARRRAVHVKGCWSSDERRLEAAPSNATSTLPHLPGCIPTPQGSAAVRAVANRLSFVTGQPGHVVAWVWWKSIRMWGLCTQNETRLKRQPRFTAQHPLRVKHNLLAQREDAIPSVVGAEAGS